MMTSSTKTSEKIYIQTDCDSDRINSLQVDLYSKPMGFGEVDQIQPEEGYNSAMKCTSYDECVEQYNQEISCLWQLKFD